MRMNPEVLKYILIGSSLDFDKANKLYKKLIKGHPLAHLRKSQK